MKRPFFVILFIFVSSILILLNFNIYILIMYYLLNLFIFLYIKNDKLVVVLILLLFYTLYLNNTHINIQKPKFNEYIGNIQEYNLSSEDKFVLSVRKIKKNNMWHDKRFKILITFEGNFENLIGKTVRFKNDVYIPNKNTNPNMFNYRKYLLSKDIIYTSFADADDVKILRSNRNFTFYIMKFRKKLVSKINKIYEDRYSEFIKAFILGYNIQENKILEKFYTVGLGHILVISGLHFGILYLILKNIFRFIYIDPKVKLFIIFLILFLFLLLTGTKISGIRTFIMLLAIEYANSMNRRFDLLNFVSLLTLIFIIINPFIIYSLSFILSFGAVISIGFFYQKIPRSFPEVIKLIISVQILITIIGIEVFNYKNLATFFINIPINFIVGVLFFLILLNFIFYKLKIFTYLITLIINSIYELVEFTEKLTFFKIDYIFINKTIILIMIFVFGYFIYTIEIKEINKKTSVTSLIILILITILSFNISVLNNEEINVYFFDVGEGDCILIQTPQEQNILIDGGPDTAYDKISNILIKNKIRKIDFMILTHAHNDHINGLSNVVKNLKVNKFIYSNKFKNIEQFSKLDLIKVNKNDKIIINEVNLEILNPIEQYEYKNINNSSIVIKAKIYDKLLLLTGDIDGNIEKFISKQINKKIDILKVSHHGSKYSSDELFIRKINPDYAVIQCGENNYSHPNKEVLMRLKENGTKIYRTDLDGAVMFRINSNNILLNKTINNGGIHSVLQ